MITLELKCRILVFVLFLDLRLILVARLDFVSVFVHGFALIFLLLIILILTLLLLLPILVVLSTAFFLALIAATVLLIAVLSAFI